MTTDPIDSYEGMRYIHRMTQLNESEIQVLERNGITKPIHLMLLDKHDIDSIFVNKKKKKEKESDHNVVGVGNNNKPPSVLKQPTQQQQQRKTSSSSPTRTATSGSGSPKFKSGSIAFATPIVSSGLNLSNYSSSNDIHNMDADDDEYVMNIVKRRSLANISTYLSRGGNLYKVNNIGDIVRYNTRTEKQKPYDWNRNQQPIQNHHHHSKESKSHSKSNKR